MIRVGLTGGIASGKSTVGDEFTRLGALVIDSDQLARDVVAPGTPGLAQVVRRFGEQVLAPDGSLDRPALGRIVFGDDQARADLNAIIHPLVLEARDHIEAQVSDPYAIVVAMIPLLVEIGMADSFDVVVVVDVAEQTQLERLMRRNGLTETEARARIASQVSRAERLAAADYVINNDGSVDELRDRVAAVWGELLWMRDHGVGPRL